MSSTPEQRRIEELERELGDRDRELAEARRALRRLGRMTSSLGATLQREGELAELRAREPTPKAA